MVSRAQWFQKLGVASAFGRGRIDRMDEGEKGESEVEIEIWTNCRIKQAVEVMQGEYAVRLDEE